MLLYIQSNKKKVVYNHVKWLQNENSLYFLSLVIFLTLSNIHSFCSLASILSFVPLSLFCVASFIPTRLFFISLSLLHSLSFVLFSHLSSPALSNVHL